MQVEIYKPVCLDGPDISSGKELGYGLDGLGSIPSVGRVEIFLDSFQTGPGVHSASYIMSTGAFPGGKSDRLRTSHLPLPSAVALYTWTLASASPVGLHGL